MQAWRRAFRETEACFVCVCVDGRAEATAREFQRLYFDRDMINAFIDSREDFPRFPTQLGCQGLVVVDAEGRFATQRSPAFLDHRNAAFGVVENTLRALATGVRGADGTLDDSAASSTDALTAHFSENACDEKPADLDDEEEFVLAKFPSVGHPEMDSDHAEIERLMRRALDTLSARDVKSLTDAFREHAAEEEALLRGLDADVGEDAENTSDPTPVSFRASSAHAADHERVLAALCAVVSSVGAVTRSRRASLISEEKVERKILRRACRAVVEHAVTYDAAYAGKLKRTA